MYARVRSIETRLLPHGWLDVARQLLLFGCFYLAYTIVRGMVEGRATAAFQHARELISLERALHLFIEPSVQAWASGSQFLMKVASWIYVDAQTSVTIGALVFLYIVHNRNFYFVRNMLMIAMVIALAGYTLFPTAPPRFLPEWGFVDSVSDVTGVRVSSAGPVSSAVVNLYAAVPSMHVAFALMIGWPLARLARWRVARAIWFTYPFLITFVIVVTANHFLVDAMLGALTAGVSAYGAVRLARARPSVWAFSPVAAGVGAAG
jgi:PAP2 superfamily protein